MEDERTVPKGRATLVASQVTKIVTLHTHFLVKTDARAIHRCSCTTCSGDSLFPAHLELREITLPTVSITYKPPSP